MKQFNTIKAAQTLALTAILSIAAVPAYAQSGNGALGAVIGGSAGAIIGGSVDNRGSNSDGVIAGAALGGTLGYLIGSQNDDHDRRMRRRYSSERGEYYRHNGQSYRRFHDGDHGYASIHIANNDPFYYPDGRARHSDYYASRGHYNRRHHNRHGGY